MRLHLHVVLLIAFLTTSASGADLYESQIKPLLKLKCSACHGALKQQAELRLDAGRLILKGGESGSAVNVKDVEGSLIIQRITAKDADQRMPPIGEGEPLNAKQVEILRQWIRGGARIPKSEVTPLRPADHWAFKLPRKANLPQSKSVQDSNPIDVLISEPYPTTPGLKQAALADRATLLRRLYFDLIGLPPSRKQLVQFLADKRTDALERVAGQLLNSPLHGQRWGRHWMDVWRYSDWHGYKMQVRGSQRHIWRWRDWIVESINQDRGYDRMVIEMLAGDEIAPTDPKTLRATGFLVRNFHASNRNIWLDATVEHTAKAFLGLTIKCARCHDHKYDPILQRDFYAFRAIFEPHNVRTQRVGKEKNVKKAGLVRAYDKDLKVNTYLYLRGNEKYPDKKRPIRPSVPSFFNHRLAITLVQLPSAVWQGKRIPAKKKKRGGPLPRTSTGRRLALARWIANHKNPLTARVAVNHIWTRHFGRPLVARLDDFGLRSPRPRYAKLLDWLAVELMENGWRMKHIHRLIVTSRTWQLTSSVDRQSAVSKKLDPDNTYYWRANARRLESEAIRDSILFVAGSLDVSLGGPDIAHGKGERVLRRSLYFQHAYEKQMKMMVLFDGASPNECYRREESVIPQQALVLANSDLSLSQSRKLARRLWKQSQASSTPNKAFIVAVFYQLLSRRPTRPELVVCEEFLRRQPKRLADQSGLTKISGGAKPSIAPAKDPVMRAKENLVHVMMNHNDFITIR